MSTQRFFARQCLLTHDTTLCWFFFCFPFYAGSSVRPFHMPSKLQGRGKCFVAYNTAVVPLLGMSSSHMLGPSAGMPEAPLAFATTVGLLARVNPHMYLQTSSQGKCLGAFRAFVRPVPLQGSEMLLEMRLPVEYFRTVRTGRGFLLHVGLFLDRLLLCVRI
jgi:hypothetical protein